ncbi:hypothetical protein GQ44DRAFT_46917 [Phaeosphaeriaceae sp. PMI808]|nr:hypothetical protein GQ44DRAFT_46917 [Phaeosphaeriaceae sp. PMI808]
MAWKSKSLRQHLPIVSCALSLAFLRHPFCSSVRATFAALGEGRAVSLSCLVLVLCQQGLSEGGCLCLCCEQTNDEPKRNWQLRLSNFHGANAPIEYVRAPVFALATTHSHVQLDLRLDLRLHLHQRPPQERTSSSSLSCFLPPHPLPRRLTPYLHVVSTCYCALTIE